MRLKDPFVQTVVVVLFLGAAIVSCHSLTVYLYARFP